MLSQQQRQLIRNLVLIEHQSIRKVARMLEISLNTVRRYVRNPQAPNLRVPKSANGKFLLEHAQEVFTLYQTCHCNCSKLQIALKEQFDIDASLRMLERFCRKMREQQHNP